MSDGPTDPALVAQSKRESWRESQRRTVLDVGARERRKDWKIFPEKLESDRIIEIPRYEGPATDTIDKLLDLLVFEDAPDDAALLDTQITALATLVETKKLAGFITTGAGKTLIMLLAMRALGLTRGVALVRPDLIEQAVDEVERFAHAFAFDERLHLLSYGVLQHHTHERRLWELRPQIILADEAHELGNTSSARWIRVRDYCKDFPETIFVPMSGSLSTSSVRDYAHLLDIALGDQTPLPRDKAELAKWARCLDAESIPRRADMSSIAPLCDAFGGLPIRKCDTLSAWQDEVRGAYARRLASTPGVLIIDKASWPGAIILEEHRNPKLPEDVQDAIDHVLETGTSPDGQIVFASDDEAYKAISELVCGFWYKWVWPATIAPDERSSWRMARADWSRFVRHEIEERGVAGYDSPWHVAGAVARQIKQNGGEPDLPIEIAYIDWLEWRGRLWARLEAAAYTEKGFRNGSGNKPPTVPVWISEYLVDDCEAWLAENAPAILWYRHRAFGALLEARGVAVYNTRKRRMGLSSILTRRGAHNAALPYACAVGRNLQAYQRMRTAGIPPANSKAWEQVLGRVARLGQQADEVRIHVDATNKWATRALERARKGAAFVLATQGMGQKLLDAERRIVP